MLGLQHICLAISVRENIFYLLFLAVLQCFRTILHCRYSTFHQLGSCDIVMHFLWVLFQPLGASDYLEISKHFDTVFVRDIPLLTMAKRTQAHRFITLIDTFYEHKVRAKPFLYVQSNIGSPKI